MLITFSSISFIIDIYTHRDKNLFIENYSSWTLCNDGVDVEGFLVDSVIEFLFYALVVVDFYGDSQAVNVCDNVAVYFYHHLPIVVARVFPYPGTCVALAMVGASVIILERP